MGNTATHTTTGTHTQPTTNTLDVKADATAALTYPDALLGIAQEEGKVHVDEDADVIVVEPDIDQDLPREQWFRQALATAKGVPSAFPPLPKEPDPVNRFGERVSFSAQGDVLDPLDPLGRAELEFLSHLLTTEEEDGADRILDSITKNPRAWGFASAFHALICAYVCKWDPPCGDCGGSLNGMHHVECNTYETMNWPDYALQDMQRHRPPAYARMRKHLVLGGPCLVPVDW